MYLEVKNLVKHYDSAYPIIKDLTFSIKKGEFFCVLGPSGCGKSTLLNIMAGFEKPTTGKVLIDGTEVKEPNPKYVTIFQEYALFPWKTVLQNVEYGFKGNIKEKEKIAMKYVKLVNLVLYLIDIYY